MLTDPSPDLWMFSGSVKNWEGQEMQKLCYCLCIKFFVSGVRPSVFEMEILDLKFFLCELYHFDLQ